MKIFSLFIVIKVAVEGAGISIDLHVHGLCQRPRDSVALVVAAVVKLCVGMTCRRQRKWEGVADERCRESCLLHDTAGRDTSHEYHELRMRPRNHSGR